MNLPRGGPRPNSGRGDRFSSTATIQIKLEAADKAAFRAAAERAGKTLSRWMVEAAKKALTDRA